MSHLTHFVAVVSLAPNTLTVIGTQVGGVAVASDQLVVAFSIASNPNGSCLFGYTASLAADVTIPAGGACTSPAGRNLIFDPAQGWWDVSRFQIGGQQWCGRAFNGNWVIRACVGMPAGSLIGTGDDLALSSAVGTEPLSAALGKSAAGGESVTFSLTSPAGTFQSSLGFLLLDLYLSAGPLPAALAPGFHVSAPPIVVGPQLLTMPFEPSFVIPTTLAGVTLMGQGTVLSLDAGNGLYATTAAHLVLLR